MNHRLFLFLGLLGFAAQLLVPLPLSANSNWPAWRGPDGSGSNSSGSYPDHVADDNILWKIALPAKGCSTPIIWEDTIYLTGPADGQDSLTAFNWDGKQLWQTAIGPENAGRHRNGSGSNPSPITDGERIFVAFKSGRLGALDLAGELLWETDLLGELKKWKLYWDFGTSPVLTAEHVVMAVMHGGESFLVAFDKATGKQAWKTDRTFQTPVENDHGYTTPIVVDNADGSQTIVTWGAEHLTAHAAGDGKLLWSSAGFNPNGKKNWVAVASHVHSGDIALVPYGRGARLAAIKLDAAASGDITESHRLWDRESSTFVPTPIVYQGQLYLLKDRGEVECVDPKTGATVWSGKLPRSSGNYYSSPSIADGKLYAAREDGTLFIASIEGEQLKVLSENKLGEPVIASPVPINNRLLLRGTEHLFCVGAP